LVDEPVRAMAIYQQIWRYRERPATDVDKWVVSVWRCDVFTIGRAVGAASCLLSAPVVFLLLAQPKAF